MLTVFLEGKPDTGAGPQAEKELEADVADALQLVLDMNALKYFSSAGFRMILKLRKTMKEKDGMVSRNVNESIMEVSDLTGFSDILNIE